MDRGDLGVTIRSRDMFGWEMGWVSSAFPAVTQPSFPISANALHIFAKDEVQALPPLARLDIVSHGLLSSPRVWRTS